MGATALQDLHFPANNCFGCGPANPDGFQLKSYPQDEGTLAATWVAPARFAGPPGVVNGGVLSIPMDCHATWAAIQAFTDQERELRGAVTASYQMRLRRPTPVEQPVHLVAEVVSIEGRRATARCEASVAGDVTAVFEGSFVKVEPYEY